MNLYVTADVIGTPTGGGRVTLEESEALQSLGPCEVWGREHLQQGMKAPLVDDPCWWDRAAKAIYHGKAWGAEYDCRDRSGFPKIAHLYSGTFSDTVESLKFNGCKVTYTVAAHDRQISQEEHESLGIPFAYPHLTEEGLWLRYIEGYRQSDVIVCPSTVAAATVRAYGPEFRDKRIEVIPHGCDLLERTAQLPARFTCGYLGSYGADKGVRYLLEAWKKLAYKDAVLMLGGRDSTTAGRALYNAFGGGNVIFTGWVKNVSDFYNQLSLYVQPSATEGFGIEVLESMAHGRPVLCSDGAGASDVVDPSGVFPARNAGALAEKIHQVYWISKHDLYPLKEGKLVQDEAFPTGKMDLTAVGKWNRGLAEQYTWDKIWRKYISLWRSLL